MEVLFIPRHAKVRDTLPLYVWLTPRSAPVDDDAEVLEVDLPKLQQQQREPGQEGAGKGAVDSSWRLSHIYLSVEEVFAFSRVLGSALGSKR